LSTTAPQAAFIVRVPEAEPYVATWRDRFDPAARLGVPAHITVLFPFMPPERIDGVVLEKAQAIASAMAPFSFRLVRIERFPGVLYLAPEPAEPFVALTHAFARSFPEFPPYGGQFATVVPHLTVGHASDPELAPVASALRASLPPGGVTSSCRRISLIENSTGHWLPMHELPLRGMDHLPSQR
jgi:2'-5' RNA ligase